MGYVILGMIIGGTFATAAIACIVAGSRYDNAPNENKELEDVRKSVKDYMEDK